MGERVGREIWERELGESLYYVPWLFSDEEAVFIHCRRSNKRSRSWDGPHRSCATTHTTTRTPTHTTNPTTNPTSRVPFDGSSQLSVSLIESELPAGDAFAIACVWVGCAAHELCGELCVALGRSAVQQRPPVVHAAALGRVHLDDASVNLLEELSAHVVGRERVRVGHGECVLGVCVCAERAFASFGRPTATNSRA